MDDDILGENNNPNNLADAQSPLAGGVALPFLFSGSGNSAASGPSSMSAAASPGNVLSTVDFSASSAPGVNESLL